MLVNKSIKKIKNLGRDYRKIRNHGRTGYFRTRFNDVYENVGGKRGAGYLILCEKEEYARGEHR